MRDCLIMRPENERMRLFLKSNGFTVTPKYLAHGSMRGCWRFYRPGSWTQTDANALNALGFSGFDGRPLDLFSGNGGLFCVFVRGHNELLNP